MPPNMADIRARKGMRDAHITYRQPAYTNYTVFAVIRNFFGWPAPRAGVGRGP